MLLVAGLSSPGFSQTDADVGWTVSTTTSVKPERREEFEASLKQVMEAYKEAGTPWFFTLQNLAGDTTEYTTVVPVKRFGDLDGPPLMARVLGERGWRKLARKLGRCYTTETRQFSLRQPDLEINRVDVPLGGYWLETRTLVTQDRMDDYLRWLKDDYLPALRASRVAHFLVSRPVFGGPGGEVIQSRMLRSLAEIDGGPVLAKALGETEARAANARSAPLVRSSTTRIVLMRTDLSYSTARPPDN
ncbi:MAG: hypothetical protein ACM3JH_15155 [Acidithiobacillales bacterium]